MAQTTFRMNRGDTVALPEGVAGRQLWRVEKRLRAGYLMSSLSGMADRTWSHDEIQTAWYTRRMEHWPADLSGLDAKLAEMLQTDIERWPDAKIFEARCREAYMKRVDELIVAGVGKYEAYGRASKEIGAEREAGWKIELAALREREAASASPRRKVRSLALAAAPVNPLSFGFSAVKKWWVRWDGSGRDLRALISMDHCRGDHSPRFPDRRGEQADDDDVRCVYGAMEYVGRTIYMAGANEGAKGLARASTTQKTFAYERLLEELAKRKLPSVSKTTFLGFLRKRFDAFEEHRARFGPRSAYLKFHIFARRQLPERAMEEVEVDHCLLDVFVTDRHGRTGRPWLTVLICRATKMIVGMHLGFDPPSSETLSRAVLHAILPKVLDGVGAERDWPCMGGFDMLITDRGLEFLSAAFQRSGDRLKFQIVNLPGRSPWLKATVERFFGTLGVRVLSRLEGSTKARAADWYDPQAKARYALNELAAKIVRWIVDDYHEREHATLQTSPRQRWRELAVEALDGGVRVPPPFKEVYRCLGEGGITRSIGNYGITFDNNHYSAPELESFRREHKGFGQIEIIAEFFDRSFIWAKLGGQWVILEAAHASKLKGVSRFSNRMVNRLARKLTPKGEDVTEDTIDKARRICEEAARTMRGRHAMRFGSDGALATDVMGNDGLLSVLANGLVLPPQIDVTTEEDPGGIAGTKDEASNAVIETPSAISGSLTAAMAPGGETVTEPESSGDAAASSTRCDEVTAVGDGDGDDDDYDDDATMDRILAEFSGMADVLR